MVQNSYEKLFKNTNHLRRHSVHKRDLTSHDRHHIDAVVEEFIGNKPYLYQNSSGNMDMTTIQTGSTRHERAVPSRGKSSQCKMRKGSRHNHCRYDRMSGNL